MITDGYSSILTSRTHHHDHYMTQQLFLLSTEGVDPAECRLHGHPSRPRGVKKAIHFALFPRRGRGAGEAASAPIFPRRRREAVRAASAPVVVIVRK